MNASKPESESEPTAAPVAHKGWLRSFFLMQDELSQAQQRHLTPDGPGWLAFATCQALAESARYLIDPPGALKHSDGRGAALLLYTEALHWALVAHVERAAKVQPAQERAALWADWEDCGREDVLRGLDQETIDQARAAFLEDRRPCGSHDDTETIGKLNAVEQVVASHLLSLEREAAAVRRVKLSRALRIVGIPLAILGLVGGMGAGIRHALKAPNLALNKPVSASSQLAGHPLPPGAVDGDRSTLGFCTREEPSPWLRIDLQSVRKVNHVRVFNRSDGWSERAVPLVLEGSIDGNVYRELIRKSESFGVWNARFAPTEIRFLRVKVPTTTYLHLNEVEIY